MLFYKVILLLVFVLFFKVIHCTRLLPEETQGLSLNDSNCIDLCLSLVSKSFFYQCMKNCSSSWLFEKNDSCANAYPVKNQTTITSCSPKKIEIKTLKKKLQSGEFVQYLYLSWTPCPDVIDHLSGYAIAVISYDMRHCYFLHLQQKFCLSPTKGIMWFVIPDPVANRRSLKVGMLPVPFNANQTFLWMPKYLTNSCASINGPHSCFCEYDILDPPKIKVLGYTIEVAFHPAFNCFSPEFYDVYLHSRKTRYCMPKSSFCEKRRLSQPLNDSTPMRFRFNNVFDSYSDGLVLKIVTAYKEPLKYVSSRKYPVTIKAWSPPQPIITDRGSGEYEAKFSFPPTNFLIPAYVFRISTCDRANSSVKIVSALKEYVVNSSSAVNGSLRQRFDLKEGLYCIQIRESRTKSLFKYFDKAKWGPVKAVVVKADVASSILYVIMGVTASFIFFITSIFVFIFLARTGKNSGKTKRLRKFIPRKWANYFKIQQFLSRKTVLLVWQSDFRSQLLNDSYKEVVRSFGSFLVFECGLEVILDQCEEINKSTSYTQWISKSEARADIVLFICPHFDYSKNDEKCQISMGNFTCALRFMKKDILSNIQKYVFVVFPFADLNLNSHTKFLHNMVTTYSIMQEIEDLYCRIQGITKHSLFVKMSAGNISESLYTKTEVERDLHKQLIEFGTELKKFNATHHSSSNSSDNECCFSRHFLDYQELPPSIHANQIPKARSGHMSSIDCQPTPQMAQSLSNLVDSQVCNSPI